ncbi:MAG: 16S rRNA (guanine(527)-N(7))-methyltransferase RsmG [Oligoflexia bacterium]|nr:16S rRNA (guanine(527)-N(7))-methyltransferase RsmG [Oligoflexia bacterium]
MQKYRINKLFPYLIEEKKKKIKLYFDLLIKWNNKINLISRPTQEEADIIHIADAIFGSEIIYKSKPQSPIYDLGSGNGIPGVIFSILYNDINVVCVDSDQRKTAFLTTVKTTLNLSNLEVKNIRILEIKERPKCFMARGLASINDSLAEVEFIKDAGTRFFHFKSADWTKETDKCSTWNNHILGKYSLKTDKEEASRLIIESKPI